MCPLPLYVSITPLAALPDASPSCEYRRKNITRNIYLWSRRETMPARATECAVTIPLRSRRTVIVQLYTARVPCPCHPPLVASARHTPWQLTGAHSGQVCGRPRHGVHCNWRRVRALAGVGKPRAHGSLLTLSTAHSPDARYFAIFHSRLARQSAARRRRGSRDPAVANAPPRWSGQRSHRDARRWSRRRGSHRV